MSWLPGHGSAGSGKQLQQLRKEGRLTLVGLHPELNLRDLSVNSHLQREEEKLFVNYKQGRILCCISVSFGAHILIAI